MTQPLSDAAVETVEMRSLSRFLHVMPLAFITYGLAYLDRVNYASAASRLAAARHLSPGQAPVVLSIFFIGYCLFQIPGAIYASRRSVRWLVFWALIAWGILSGLTGVISSIPWLIADRILLGAVEGVVLPSMLIYLTRWFTRPERSRSNAILMLTNPSTMFVASALCGSLIQFFDAYRFHGYAGWQMMFIVEGLPSIVWAFFWIALSRERPADASWLAPADAAAVQSALDREQQSLKHLRDYWEAFFDIRVLLLAGMFFCFCSAAYGFMMWLPGIVEEGSKTRPALAGVLTSIPYLMAMCSMIILSWWSDRTLLRKPFVVGSLIVGCIAFCIAYAAGPGHFLIAFLGLMVVGSCIYTPTSPLWAWMAEMLPRNVVGESMALVNSAGALGGFFGSWIVGVLKEHFHSNGVAFMFQAACFALAALLGVSAQGAPRETGLPEAV